jgi:hypothetical protein
MTDKGTYSQLRELRVLTAQQGFQLQLAGRRELHDSRYWLTVSAKQARLGVHRPDDVSELFPVSVRLHAVILASSFTNHRLPLQKLLPFSRRQCDLDHEDIIEGIGLTMVEHRVGHPYPFLLNCTHISIADDYQERQHKESL